MTKRSDDKPHATVNSTLGATFSKERLTMLRAALERSPEIENKWLQLREIQQRIGTSAELPSDLGEVESIAHQLSNALMRHVE